jgi:hypothetical protein
MVREQEDEILKGEMQDLRAAHPGRACRARLLPQTGVGPFCVLGRTDGALPALVFIERRARGCCAVSAGDAVCVPGRTCVMASATLSTGSEGLGVFRNRVGAIEVRALRIGSSLRNFLRPDEIVCGRKTPDPKEADAYERLWRTGLSTSFKDRKAVLVVC